jgi:hypothetical protein
VSTKQAEKTLKATEARGMEWCLVIDGKVHAAIWNEGDGKGYLTTYTTVENRKGNTKAVCMGQRWTALDELEHPWEDRAVLAKKLKIKVCKICEEE